MENIVGKKMKGFEFGRGYVKEMDKHIGEIGVITNQDEGAVTVQFKEDWWNYPLPEALEHIVQEETIVPKEPIVPELGEGVMMEVSQNQKQWLEKRIIAKYKNNYITNMGVYYQYARPIQPKKVTMEELEQLVGGKFEIIK